MRLRDDFCLNWVTLPMAQASGVESRLRAILQTKERQKLVTRKMSSVTVAIALAILVPLAVLRPVAEAQTKSASTRPVAAGWQTVASNNVHTGKVLRRVRAPDNTVLVLKVRQHTIKGDVIFTLDSRPTRFLYRLRPKIGAILMVTDPLPLGDNQRIIAIDHQGHVLPLDRFTGMEGYFSGRTQITYTLPRAFLAQVSEFRLQVRPV